METKFKTTERFERAVSKLYNAFHLGELNALDACCCVVGNLCNNNGNWHPLYADMTKEKFEIIAQTNYSRDELRNAESIFMHGGDWREWTKHGVGNRDMQFKGLCAVVEYLAELDGIPNLMDYKALFETQNDKPKKQLCEVFVTR